VRLAALLHDVGKPRTRGEGREEGEATFYGHQTVGADMTRGALERLRFSRDDRERVAGLVEEHMFHYTPDWSNAAVRRFLRRVGPSSVGELFALRRADDAAHGTGKDSGEVLADLQTRIDGVRLRDEALTVKDLAVGGRDVMEALDLAPGPEVGRVLAELLERVLEDPGLNRRDSLLALAREVRGT
jgi:putative nucleotidyltransferase with HDIG domain